MRTDAGEFRLLLSRPERVRKLSAPALIRTYRYAMKQLAMVKLAGNEHDKYTTVAVRLREECKYRGVELVEDPQDFVISNLDANPGEPGGGSDR